MNYSMELNNRPFLAIQVGTKKVECRTPRDETDVRYNEMKQGDTLTFINNVTQEIMNCEILFVTKYSDSKLLLETEGTKNVLSSGLGIEGGIESINNIEGYRDRIKQFGIYAIGVRPL